MRRQVRQGEPAGSAIRRSQTDPLTRGSAGQVGESLLRQPMVW